VAAARELGFSVLACPSTGKPGQRRGGGRRSRRLALGWCSFPKSLEQAKIQMTAVKIQERTP